MNHAALSNLGQPQPVEVLTVDALTVQVYESAEAVAQAGSMMARQILRAAIGEKGSARAIFATGRSQLKFLSHLTDPAAEQPIDWSSVTGFHLDEYLGIAVSHPASFRRYLKEHLTSKVLFGQWHDIEGDGLLPLTVCQMYEKHLHENPIDLCCLGIGNNGHLAFNDPDVADFSDPQWVKIVRLDAQNRQQQAESDGFGSLDAVPQYAFTLTLSAIRAAGRSLCLAYGQSKSDIVHRVVSGSIDESCPASLLKAMPQATLLIDRAAASQSSQHA